MNIRFLRIFIFLMCALAAGIADAHTLHVGNKSFELSQTKYTTPSLAFAVPNEATWYAPLTTQNLLITTLRLNINNQKYSLCTPPEIQNVPENCDCIFTDTENYTYDENGRLIGADEDLYIMANNTTSYVNTLFFPTSDTRVIAEGSTPKGGIFFSARTAQKIAAFSFMYPGTANIYTFRTDYATVQNFFDQMPHPEGKKAKVDKNKNITTVYLEGGRQQTITQRYTNFSASVPLTLFAINDGEIGVMGSTTQHKMFYIKIWSNGADENTLVRNMVPVPACMRIGDFVVPENGMWDIVEQKFYGNSGTGSFIYGKDE